ncbi:MAG: hypothetical protein IPG07_15140 [Crocinitomicaceae bacterium]|nr:hypothetical protein [Crocinitomicaceae bacterium]
MGKTSFQNIQNLIKEIEQKLAQLTDGNLPVAELENLVKNAADLHERLAVLRYKAYEKFGEPKLEAVLEKHSEPKVEPVAETAFDFSAINETVTATPVAEEKEEVEETIDFSAPLFEAPIFDAPKVEKKETPVVEAEVKKPIHVIREEIKQESASLHEKFLKEEEIDLNDKLKQKEEIPLRKKLGLQPIKDLRAEIGIGKKFEYINFLFNGDARAYETAIDELNTVGNAESAKQKLNVYASVYQWDLEEKTIIKFVELVERRYL